LLFSAVDDIIATASSAAVSLLGFLSTGDRKLVIQLLINAELPRQMRKSTWKLFLRHPSAKEVRRVGEGASLWSPP